VFFVELGEKGIIYMCPYEAPPISTSRIWSPPMTVILTFVGLFVFIISLVTSGFKSAFRRMLMFTLTGVVLDMIIGTTAFAVSMIAAN